VNTNNITESFNNVLRRRYLPLRHDTTVFAFVQVLTEVAFPEQESKYFQTVIKQSQAYRKPRYEMPPFLIGRPHKVQSLCMLNMERAKFIPKSDLMEVQKGVFDIQSRRNIWKIDLTNGTCTCPAFTLTKIPCKHFFAVFYHFSNWSWSDLPSSLTDSCHMVLDKISDLRTDVNMAEEDNIGITCTTSINQELPRPKQTTAKQIHFLQKQIEDTQIEDTVAKCRTLAFLTNNIETLQQALAHCEAAREKLVESATYTKDYGVPIYTAIEKAGVEEFKQTTKLLHREHSLRKTTRIQKEAKSDPLQVAATRGIGRPKLKQSRRKLHIFPRQMSDGSKIKILKATRLLQKG